MREGQMNAKWIPVLGGCLLFVFLSPCVVVADEESKGKEQSHPSGLEAKSDRMPVPAIPRKVRPQLPEDVQDNPAEVVEVPDGESRGASDIEEIPDGYGDDSHYTLLEDETRKSPLIEEPSQDGEESNPVQPSVVNSPFMVPEITRRQTNTKYRSVSASKQFIITGTDRQRCAALSTHCEKIKRDFLSILSERDSWNSSITIHTVGQYGDRVSPPSTASHIDLAGGKPFYNIYVKIGQGIDYDALDSEILKILMYERALRKVPENAFPDQLHLPIWLIEGVNEAIQWKNNTINRNLYATLFDRGDIFALSDLFLVTNPYTDLDASSLGVYKATAGSLMLCLLNQPGGQESFKRMMDQSIISPVDGETLLKQNFPGLHLSRNSLYKWWALQLSQMSMRPMTEALTMLETERLLDEYARISYFDPEAKAIIFLTLGDYKSLLGFSPENRTQIMHPMIADLVRLSYRSFPAQSGIVLEYIKLAESIKKGKVPGDIDARLAALKEKRAQAARLGARTRDYMDWYTIVTSNYSTGSFDSYVRAMNILREKKILRTDDISNYLNDMEKMAEPVSKESKESLYLSKKK